MNALKRITSYYALTDGFRKRIRDALPGPLDFVQIGQLRNLGPKAFFTETRRLKAPEIYVAVEDENSRPIVGPLLVLAALSGTRRIGVIWPDGAVERVSHARIARMLLAIAADQVASRIAYRRALHEAKAVPSKSLEMMPRNDSRRILYLDANLSFGLTAGGSIGHTRGVIDGFVGKGFEVDYASVKPIPTQVPGARWLRIDSPSLYSFPAELNYYRFAAKFEGKAAASANRPYRFLYQRMSLHNISGLRLRRQLKIPLVLEFNGSEAWAGTNWATTLALPRAALATETACLQGADLVVTVSDVLADQVEAAGVPRERIVCHPNCIDPAIFNPERFAREELEQLRWRLNISPDAQVWAFIGTFGIWHGVDFLARNVAHLIEHDLQWLRDNRVHFLFVGDGLKMAEVQTTLGPAIEKGFATLAGLVPQSEAPVYLAASDGFLSPHMPNPDGSPFFGSPTKLFEYMAMERPIVASDLAQIGEVLRDERSNDTGTARPLAALYTPGNGSEFRAAFRRVVEEPLVAREMARRARAEVLRHYTWAHHVEAILERLNGSTML